MFIPIRKNLFRWGTPDPESDWMMFGHLIIGDEGSTLVDPPLVPGLIEYVERLGKITSVILTTLDHSRASAFLVEKTGARLYVPDQSPDDVDPYALRLLKQVSDHEVYKQGKILEFTAHRLQVNGDRGIGMPSMNEFALRTQNSELIVGDFVSVSTHGEVLVAPEWFPSDKKPAAYQEGRRKFKSLVETTGAKSLLTSHGNYVIGDLKEHLKTM